MDIPIVIAAYNRDRTLSRLLTSLAKSDYTNSVKLIISIDGGGSESVKTAARDFDWVFGPKEVIEHPENMGLRRHILFCGGLSKKYDGIILLEDDLFVSPWFYNYTLAALKFYRDNSVICGVSLYSYRYNETSFLSFTPLNDGSDTYFMQLPCSWGQAWLKEHWSEFESWYEANCSRNFSDDLSLPVNIAQWPMTSWKKFFAKYMIEQNKFFVYPMHSYSTNFGDKGQHHQGSNLYQVPIVLGKTPNYYFRKFEESTVKYDSHCEVLPECLNDLCGGVFNYNLSVDLHGSKKRESLIGDFVLTTKECASFVRSFGRVMFPIEMNIINQISGNDIYLAKVDQIENYGDITEHIRNNAINIQTQQYYYNMDSLHYSLLHRAEARMSELFKYNQVIESAYNETTRHLGAFSSSLSWRLTAPLRKLLDAVKSLWRKS